MSSACQWWSPQSRSGEAEEGWRMQTNAGGTL